MGKLLPQDNAGQYKNIITGDISFQQGRMFIPTPSAKPATAVPGEIVFVDSDGCLLVASGGNPLIWHTYDLSGIIPDIDPTAIPDIVFWFEAISGEMYDSTGKDTLTQSGSTVLLWNDKSGNGNDANAMGSLGPPAFVPNVIRNGLDSLQFQTTEGLNVSGIAQGIASGADPQFTYFAFLKFDQVGAMNVFAAAAVADVTNYIEIGTIDTTEWGTRKGDDAPSIIKIGGPVHNTSGLYLLEWGTQGGDGQTLSIWQNGSGIIDQEGYTTSENTYDIDTFTIGGKKDSAGENGSLSADVVELIAYSGQITDDHRIALQAYFHNKYHVVMSGDV